MISQTSEHALRAILFLAQQPAGTAVSADRVARALGAPPNYLSKTLNALARMGIVASTRGAGGGFRLAVPADELTVARVVEGFQAARPNRVCLLGDRPCDDAAPCEAHFRWKALTGELWEPLCRTTVADLLSQAVHGAGPNAGNPRSAAPAA